MCLRRNCTISQHDILQEIESTPPSSHFLVTSHLKGQNSLKYLCGKQGTCWSFNASFWVRSGWHLMSLFPQSEKLLQIQEKQHEQSWCYLCYLKRVCFVYLFETSYPLLPILCIHIAFMSVLAIKNPNAKDTLKEHSLLAMPVNNRLHRGQNSQMKCLAGGTISKHH